MTTELLRLEDVTCYGDRNLPLVAGVSFAVNAGQVLWVTGSMGMGKTTLLEVIIKERRPDSGNVFFQSQPFWGRGAIARAKLRRQIGVIFQEDNLLPGRSVFENAAEALKISGCAHGQVEEQTYQALREVELAAKAELNVAALSSSERRLISLARVLARRPHLVVADLNTCEIDQQTIAPRLEALAKYGCGVVILSKQRSHTDTAAGKAAELELR